MIELNNKIAEFKKKKKEEESAHGANMEVNVIISEIKITFRGEKENKTNYTQEDQSRMAT